MKRRDIVIGVALLAILAGALYFRNRNTAQQEMVVPETLSSVETQLEERFKVDIPDDVDKAELSPEEGVAGSGIATRKFEDGKFSHEILADLPDPESGKFYSGWIVKGEEGSDDYSLVSTGKFRIAKGGWVLNFESNSDLSDHGRVMVTSEEKADTTPEETVLEGSF